MIDISDLGFQFRDAPVTLMSEGVEALLLRCGYRCAVTGLSLILSTATNPGKPDEFGCIFKSCAIGGEPVWVERFDCTFKQGRHEGGQWSVFLQGER